MDFSSPLESDKRKDGVLKNAVLFSHADLEPERTPGSFCCLPMRLAAAAATAAVIIAVGAVVAEEQQDDDQNDDPGTATKAEIVTTTHERFLLVRT